MDVYCLSNKAWQPCYVVRLEDTIIMLDCALDLSTLLNFVPLPLVFSPKLSSLPFCHHAAGETQPNLFRENVDYIFADSAPLVWLPETELVDFSMVDVLLISSCFSMMALPYLIETFKFRGRIYATEPTKQLGKQLMDELCEYIQRSPVPDRASEWRDRAVLSSLPECALRESIDVYSWRPLYSKEAVAKAISHIVGVSYEQHVDLYGRVKAIPLSSGFCLGSCNWLLETQYSKVSYISSSSTFTTHPCPMDRPRLLSCDVMIMCSLTNAHSANPDDMLGELCTRMATTLRNGGNVLIPCYPTGVVYDLLECLYMFLDNAGLSQVPVYFISPVAKSSLSFANIYAEWLCEGKQSKVYLPEQPFPHAEFLRSGRLKHFPNIHGELGSVYQTPCVVFTGHPTLRCGDAVHFMETWGSSNKNAVIFTEPGFDYLHALAPYQPLNMKAFYFPIDPCLNFFVANKLLKELTPRCLLAPINYLPEAAQSQKETTCLQPEMTFHGTSRGSVTTVPLSSKFQRIQLTPELAGSLLPQEVFPGVKVTSVSGLLSISSGQHILRPQPRPHKKALWGQPKVELFISALREQGIMDIQVDSTADKQTVHILSGKAEVVFTSKSSTIHNCIDVKLKGLLRDLLLRQLIQL